MKRNAIAIASAVVSGVVCLAGFGLCTFAVHEMETDAQDRLSALEERTARLEERLARESSEKYQAPCPFYTLTFGNEPRGNVFEVRRKTFCLPGVRISFVRGFPEP